jgi:hypothetical protein
MEVLRKKWGISRAAFWIMLEMNSPFEGDLKGWERFYPRPDHDEGKLAAQELIDRGFLIQDGTIPLDQLPSKLN